MTATLTPNQNLDTKDCINPTDVAHELTESVMPSKANYRKSKTFVLAIAAGALIAFGAQVSLAVMTGAELFTGNVMMTFSVIEKRTSLAKLLRNWSLVYLGNFVGSIILATLIYFSGCSHNSHEALGVMGLTTAYTKAPLPLVEAFTRGILCNWLVCLAIWMASSSRHVIGKIFAIFFPIMTFVASGYEHSIANMYFLTNGIFLKNTPAVVAASGLTADQLSVLNWHNCLFNNLIPVTLGNMVGAFVFVVLLFWTAYLRDDRHKNEEND